MRRRVPAPADVRAAIRDLRRALAQPPEALGIEWSTAGPGKSCRFCGEVGTCVRPSTDREFLVCERTVAELSAELQLPRGTRTEEILAVLERWMTPDPGGAEEEAAAPWPPSGDVQPQLHCHVCRRDAASLPRFAFCGEGASLCSDCVAGAARVIDESVHAPFEAAEVASAIRELEDLERSQRASLANPMLALSLVRLLSVPDAAVQDRIAALVLARSGA